MYAPGHGPESLRRIVIIASPGVRRLATAMPADSAPPPASDRLDPALGGIDDPDPAIRTQAARNVADLAPDDPRRDVALVRLQNDPDPGVRTAAARAGGAWGASVR